MVADKLNHRLLRVFRKDLGMTQTEAAHAVGVKVRAWQFWESGERQPKEAHLPEIARVLKKTPAELCIGFSETLQEQSILMLLEMGRILKSFDSQDDPDGYWDKLFHCHEATLKTLRAGGIIPIANPMIEDRSRLSTETEVSVENVNVDSAIEEFTNGEHDDEFDDDVPNVGRINPYEDDDE